MRENAEALLRERFRTVHGRPADYDTPSTFTEMLSARLIRLCRKDDRLLTKLTDKLRARAYAAGRIGTTHLVPLLWSGTDPGRIPFDELPPDYIIKTTHGCGGHVRVARGQVQVDDARRQIAESLTQNYRDVAQEYQYASIPPKIIIEAIVDDGIAGGPITYRFFAFDGAVGLCQADTESNSVYGFFDSAWQPLRLSYRADVTISHPPVPPRAADMMRIASRLSKGIDFVRVDLYAAGNRIYFSEMTFTPLAGCIRFDDPEWDRSLGAMWQAARRARFRRFKPPASALSL